MSVNTLLLTVAVGKTVVGRKGFDIIRYNLELVYGGGRALWTLAYGSRT